MSNDYSILSINNSLFSNQTIIQFSHQKSLFEMSVGAGQNNIDTVLLNADSHDQFIRDLMTSLVLSTKTSNAVPKGLDFNYHNTYEAHRQVQHEASNQLSGLIESVLGFVRPEMKVEGIAGDVSDPYFYDQLVETIDVLLDNAEKVLNGSTSGSISSSIKQSLVLDKERAILENVKSIPKPQNDFKNEKIDNYRENPFVPKLKQKYHSKVAYDSLPKNSLESNDADALAFDKFYPHPYEFELQTLEYPSSLLTEPNELKPQFPDPLRTHEYIENDVDLLKAINELKVASELAIDLEHHSMRTFQGLTCLMQISSRSKDYIIDTLALRHSMHLLGEIFADPSKVKVLHGCERDIVWMQRDFGLYIVNCFDTYFAAKELQFPALSLAHLVKYYCGVTLNKKYQLADWRERPLTEEMKLYAKYDTHYLLFIYDSLRRELWKKVGVEGVENVLASSKRVCMTRYEKEVFSPLGYRNLLATCGGSRTVPNLNDLSSIQDAALAKLWNWRDLAAREQDESPQYIMTNAELLRIGLKVPKFEKDILVCAPITDYVRNHLAEIVGLMAELTSLGATAFVPAVDHVKEAPASGLLARNKLDMGSISAQMKKKTIFTFTPAISALSSQTTSTSSGKEDKLASPMISTEELFRLASWKTPLLTSEESDSKKSNQSSSMLFDAMKTSFVSEESKQRMSRSMNELMKAIDSNVDFEQRLKELVKQPACAGVAAEGVNSASKAQDDAAEDAMDTLIPEIPKSYEEIYQLSSRNRKKNKDKKRNRDSVDASMESDTFTAEKRDAIISSIASDNNKEVLVSKDGFDCNQYFTTSTDVDGSVDGTVSNTQLLFFFSLE
jgi:exosome complex exonuclease RRP6